MENWKAIPNFSTYEASDLGRLRSLNYKRSKTIRVLKPAKSKDGYMKTMLLDDNGKYSSWTVHKFVALAFFGPRKEGQEINHIDCDKTNNNINNLEYTTRSENIKHAYRNSLITPKRGSLNGNSKLTEQDVEEIREHVRNCVSRYYGRKKLAEKYNVSEAHIKDIVNSRRGIWNCVSPTY